MPKPSVPRKIVFVSFALGFVLTYISPFREYLWGFQQIFYSRSMTSWQFGVVWGLVLAAIMFGGYSILKNKGHKSLIALVALLGLFYFIFSLLSSGIFGSALF